MDIINKQQEFFKTGATHNYYFRIKMLKKLKKIIEANEKPIEKALYDDLHKSYYESYETEIGTVLSEISYFQKHLRYLMRPKLVKTPINQFISHSIVYSEPYGVVLNISPWNYPFQLSMVPLIGSIASGNCSIVRISSSTPHVFNVLKNIINKNFSQSYLYCLSGNHSTVDNLIKKHPNYIFFTGSPSTGKKIMKLASDNLIPLTLELGGKSPCIIDKTANIKVAAKRIVWGKFLNAGQTCIAPDYLLVHKNIKKELIHQIFYNIISMYGKKPVFSNIYPHIINTIQYESLKKRLFLDYKNNEVIKSVGPLFNDKNNSIAPTLIFNANFNSPIMEKEIFGPILPIITFDDSTPLIEKLQNMPSPLALYIFSKNKYQIKYILKNVSFGGGCINDVVSHFANDNLPFGGVGNSGMGHYHGKYSFETLTHYKSILDKSTLFDLSLKYINHSNLNILKLFLH